MRLIQDHHGKTSQARVGALVGLAIAGALAFYRPGVEWDVLALFVLGPGGMALWQKWAPTEKAPKE